MKFSAGDLSDFHDIESDSNSFNYPNSDKTGLKRQSNNLN
jgi:hypothetical protein